MKPAFQYIVRVKLIRFLNKEKIDFIDFEETFEDENPINARNKAFECYQNFIDVLLEAKNEKYHSDKQARLTLLPFYDTTELEKIKFGGHEIDLNNSLNFGLGIFMRIDKHKPDEFNIVINSLDLSHQREEIFIHGIGNIHYHSNDPEAILLYDLTEELEYYEYYNYPTDNQIIKVSFFSKEEWRDGYGDDQPEMHRILETPFDWTGFDKTFWWGEDKNIAEPISHSANKSLREIIDSGESNQVEFKPALVYNFSTQKGGIGVKYIIAKTICSFLNSNGGYLFIGVKDDGSIQGLDYDFSLAGQKERRDFFRLEFDQMIKHFLSFVVMSDISADFQEIDGKTIFVVTVHPSFFRPVFLKGQNGKEFFVRGEASSRKLEDIEEIANYCLNMWGKK
ncbi:MAG: helix-turn-helix domain-containing protein [bacterium]